MFRSKTRANKQEKETTETGILVAEPIEPIKVKSFEEKETEEYKKLSKKLGYVNQDIINEKTKIKKLEEVRKFELYLQKEEICVYPLTKVEQFLIKIKPEAQLWVWKSVKNSSSSFREGIYSDGQVCSRFSYTKTIPIEALRLIDKISHECPSVEFYVSDYESPTPPDPFLMILINGVHYNEYYKYVIMHWDEPEFSVL